MKTVNSLKLSLLAVAGSLGLAAAAVAQTDAPEVDPIDRSGSLLGANHLSLTAGFTDLDDTGIDAHNLTLGVNQNVLKGLDATFEYDFARTERFLGSHLAQHTALIGARAYLDRGGLRPYAEAAAGWMWHKHGATSDDSFAWRGGVGLEVDVAPSVTLTPFVRYTELTSGKNDGTWDYGLSANYRVNRSWTVLATALVDDEQNVGGRLGVAFRY